MLYHPSRTLFNHFKRPLSVTLALVINCSISIVVIGQLWYFQRFLHFLISRCICFYNSCPPIQSKGVGNHISAFFVIAVSCFLYVICCFRLSAGVQCVVISVHVVCDAFFFCRYFLVVCLCTRLLCCHLFRQPTFQRQVLLLFVILYFMLFNF